MTKRQMEIRRRNLDEFLCDMYGGEVVHLDGPEFDGGIVGIARGCHLVYSYTRLVDALKRANRGWTDADAVDWIECNVIRSLPYMGKTAPIVMEDIDVSDFAPPKRKRKKPLDPEHGDVVQYGAAT